jgi:hypothetical protein
MQTYKAKCSLKTSVMVMLSRMDFSIFEACALLGYYAAYTGNSLPPFQNNLSVLSPRIKKYMKNWVSWLLKMGPIGCPETSVRNCHYMTSNTPEERRSHLLRGRSLKSRMFSGYQRFERSCYFTLNNKTSSCTAWPWRWRHSTVLPYVCNCLPIDMM